MAGTASVAIRPAVRGDAAALARLHAASFDAGWDERSFAGYVEDASHRAFVAEGPREGGAVLGFAIARSSGLEADILTICVAPEARRLGIGSGLMKVLCSGLGESGVQTVFLEVGEGNRAALALYRVLGFAQTGSRKNYYRATDGNSREPAVVLCLQLPRP